MLKNTRRKKREADAKKKEGKTNNEPKAPPPATQPPPTPEGQLTPTVANTKASSSNGKPVASITVAIDEPQVEDEDTVMASGNTRRTPTKKKSSKKNMTIEEQLEHAKSQVQQEKAGKRKIFHSLVKLANELRKTRTEALPALEHHQYMGKQWYDGGLWRSPSLLPTIRTEQRMLREPLSLLALFFNFVIVIAWTRVAGSSLNSFSSWLYMAIIWSVWCKQTAYATRFDMTDLSGQAVTALTGIGVLFTSFTVAGSLDSDDGNRVMLLASSVAILHFLLHVRVALTLQDDSAAVKYAVFSSILNLLEAIAWIVGLVCFPKDWQYRSLLFLGGFLLSLRVPRGVLPNDFQAFCSQRNVLFLLLLGFVLQNIVGVANDFLSFRTPSLEEYSFLGAICITLLCIQFLFVDDADTVSIDHALIINSWTGFFFHIGHLVLLMCLTGLGASLSTLTHEYFRGNSSVIARLRVTEGFAATLLAIAFLNSLHVKRVPSDPNHRAMFVSTYVVQAVLVISVLAVSVAMQFGYFEDLSNLELIWFVAATAVIVMVLSWTDEIVELSLYMSGGDAREARSEPLRFWCCVIPRKPVESDGSDEETSNQSSLTPLLGNKEEGYQSVDDSVDSGTMKTSEELMGSNVIHSAGSSSKTPPENVEV